MSAVICDRSDIVPIAEGVVPSAILAKLAPMVIDSFDKYFPALSQEVAGDEESDVDGQATENDTDEQALNTMKNRAARAIIRCALAKMTSWLVACDEFHKPPSRNRLKSLLESAIRPTETLGLGDIHQVTHWWRVLCETAYTRFRAPSAVALVASPAETQIPRVSTPAGSSSRSPDPFTLDEPPSMALQQLLGYNLGFPREMCIIALDRCGNNVDAAIHFCLEHSNEVEVLIEEYRWQHATRSSSNASRQGSTSSITEATSSASSAEQRRRTLIITKLKEMGFSHTWCAKALEATNNEGFNPALSWLLANGDTLDEQDKQAERQAKAEAEQQTDAAKNLLGEVKGVVAEDEEQLSPQRSVAKMICSSGGQATTSITFPDLLVSVKSATGSSGFPSVIARNLCLCKGRWYYEVTIETEQCMQIGWGDACFTGDAFEGTGVGDDAHSWAYDGYRKLKWHQQSAGWGKQWKSGDVIGCALDCDQGEMWFSLNGVWDEGMGLAFKGLIRNLNFVGGLTPAASFNRSERMRFNFGPRFKHSQGPSGWIANPPKPVLDGFLDVEANTKYAQLMRTERLLASDYSMAIDAFRDVDDCFEEAIGDALSDRYFSHGQFGSTSLLARRSSSGASGPMGIQSSSASGSSSNPFLVKEPFPRACALTHSSSNAAMAWDELLKVEKSIQGDERICSALERACETSITLYSRSACLFVLLSLEHLDEFKRGAFVESIEEDVMSMWRLIKTCAGKIRVGDVLSAIDMPFSGSVRDDVSQLALTVSPKADVLASLSPITNKLVGKSADSADSLYEFMLSELALASTRKYASIPWDDSDIAIPLVVHSLWTMAMDDHNQPMTEVKMLEHPSVRFASWASDVLHTNALEKDLRLVVAWALALRSPGTRMKIVASRQLLSFASELGEEDVDSRVSTCIDGVIEGDRVKDVARRLIARSGTSSLHAVASKYSLAMAELSSIMLLV